MNHQKLIALLIMVVLLQACRKKDADTALPQPNSLFTHQLVEEGDGLVRFMADSTQAATEFVWDFGDGTPPTTSQSGKVSHVFTRNATYQVKLVARRQGEQLTGTKTIRVATRLARTFDDLPADKRDTIRLLYVLTHDSFKAQFSDPKTYEYDAYRNLLFINFMKRTLPNRRPELDRLVFKHIVYSLPAEEMTRINQTGDPVAVLEQLLNTVSDPLYQKLIDIKRKEAVTRIAFLLKDPQPNGYGKYGFGGYAYYEGGVIVLLSTNSFSHELGHSFGMAHDTLRDCQYFPLMVGAETRRRNACGSLWNNFPEFQVNGFVNKLVVLEPKLSQGYRYAVPEYWRNQFPADQAVETIPMSYISTTPYYRSGIDMSKTLTDALITQYNIQLAPGSAINVYQNPQIPSGRLGAAKQTTPVYCLR